MSRPILARNQQAQISFLLATKTKRKERRTALEQWIHHDIYDFHLLPLILAFAAESLPTSLKHRVEASVGNVQSIMRASPDWCIVCSAANTLSFYCPYSFGSIRSWLVERWLVSDCAIYKNFILVMVGAWWNPVRDFYVRLYNEEGKELSRWSPLLTPRHIAVDEKGTVYLSGSDPVIHGYTLDGRHESTVNVVGGITHLVARQDRLFVSTGSAIFVYSLSPPRLIAEWSLPPPKSWFQLHVSFAVDTTNRWIWVTCTRHPFSLFVLDWQCRLLGTIDIGIQHCYHLQYVSRPRGQSQLLLANQRCQLCVFEY